MSRLRILTVVAAVVPLLAGCGGKTGPDLIMEADTSPSIKELRRTKPDGLLPDRENIRRSGEMLTPH